MDILKKLFILFLTRLVVKNGDGTDCTGAVTYETEYALMTEDGVYILDIGKRIERPSDTQTSYTEYFVDTEKALQFVSAMPVSTNIPFIRQRRQCNRLGCG